MVQKLNILGLQKALASVFHEDVERGPDNDENLYPLLGTDGGSNASFQPCRQRNLCHNRPQLPKLTIPEQTPSMGSTVNNTPMPESGANNPRPWRRGDRRLQRLNTELMEAIDNHDIEEVEKLLKAGANPNATCRRGLVSACHEAALTGGEALSLLVKFGAEKLRIDRLGRTPLHLAAYAGNIRQVAILLDFPEDMQVKMGTDSMSSETEEDVRNCNTITRELTDVRCDLGEVNVEVPKTWLDNIDHDCKDIKGSVPLFQPGWTPLHVASSCARKHCTRLLLAAGADPNIKDLEGRTPLDVVGYAFYYQKEINEEHLVNVIEMLLKAGGIFHTMKNSNILNDMDTPLHTAVELESLNAIQKLLDAGVWVSCLNKAGETPLHVCVRKELEEHLQLLANYDYLNVNPLLAIVDVKDKDGHSVLQGAVEAGWVPGVCITLEAGADVTSKANDGETPIHSAAARGDLDILNEILSVAKQRDALDYQNEEGETALHKAIIHGHIDCVKQILSEGSNVKIMLPGDLNILHLAADYGNVDVLRTLLDHNNAVTQSLINKLTAGDRGGFSPLHFAVSKNHKDCVKLLLSKGADVKLRTTCSPYKLTSPLHIAAAKNHNDIAKEILEFDNTTVHEVNGMGWFPLHTASNHGSREVIALLLREGADLSGYTNGPKKFRRTAIDMIINNLSKPTEFMEDIFDSYISSNGQDLQDHNCEVTVNFGILMPTVCEMEQMKVIEALLKTGNRNSQTRLLVHPLVESFLYLKWKALLPFFYTIICIYGIFLISLTIFVSSVFFYKDTKETMPTWWNINVWGYMVYASVCLILLQEVLYMNVKSKRYFLQLETWVKFGSLAFSVILPYTVTVVPLSDTEWPRHVATVALLLSWLEMMFLLSRFPNWGYYVLMFGKVATNVIKILLTFVFLVIGFSFSFMIQFRSQMPFDGPWAALVKTIVMMTSEFDYVALFDEEHSQQLATSLIIVRIIFLIFLILAAIVLMNLLVGVAVNDINDLEILGNIRRLVKQVQFLGTLDTLVYNKVFSTILPKRLNQSLKRRRKVNSVMILCPGKPRFKYSKLLPSKLKDAIFNKAQIQKKQIEDEQGFQCFKNTMHEMHNILINLNKKNIYETPAPDFSTIHDDEMLKSKCKNDDPNCHFNDAVIGEVKNQMIKYAEDSKSATVALNKRVDELYAELRRVNICLTRLESKLSK